MENNESSQILNICYLNEKDKIVINKNPHCAEFFCTLNNIYNCTKCKNYLSKHNNIRLIYKDNKDNNDDNNDELVSFCKKKCLNGYVYDFLDDEEQITSSKIDKYKIMKNFYNKKFIYTLDQIKYKINYELTAPKPRTVVHWGQLKMLLTTILFLINVIDKTDKEVHIIYAGSAPGDNIHLIFELFPNTIWYLIDPRKHFEKIYEHKQVKEIIEDYFTNETALYFANKNISTNHKLLFISDIRVEPSDDGIIKDQTQQIEWHKIIKPMYSWFKFRCPYNINTKYKYYKGINYLQPYAPISSTETRLLLKQNLIEYSYNSKKYEGKLLYFNRIIRPSYFVKSIISDNNYFDHCYDCTYFSYLIQNYITKFSEFNPYKSSNVFDIMKKMTNYIARKRNNKIANMNNYVKTNLIFSNN